MGFIRFVLASPHPDSGLEEGLFRLAYTLRDDPDVNEADRQALAELLEWFDKNLAAPSRFNRSASKGYYRRATRGIAWLRDTAKECAARHSRCCTQQPHRCAGSTTARLKYSRCAVLLRLMPRTDNTVPAQRRALTPGSGR